jgi:replicative DNA helicase
MKKISEEQIQMKLEQETLGALLVTTHKDTLYQTIEELEPIHFYYEKHKLIYRAMVKLIVQHNSVDLVMLASELSNQHLLDHIGGEIYLTKLQPSSYSDSATKYRIEELKNQSRLRNLQEACQRTMLRLNEADFETTLDLTDELANRIYEIEHQKTTQEVDIADAAMKIIANAKNVDKAGVNGYSWGLPKLDWLTSGIELNKTYVIGGQKKSGKSKLIVNTIKSLKKQNVKCLFLSLEMDGDAVVRELLSRFADIPNTTMKRKLEDETAKKLESVVDAISDGTITIDTSSFLSVNQIRSKIRRAALKGVKVVFLDYLQRMNFQLKETRDLNFATVVAHTVSQLADIAKENNVALIFLSQLANRAEKKQASIADLKDSGGIGEGVDCILILNNQDRINKTREGKVNEVWISIEQRSGASGLIKCIVDLSKAAYFEKHEESIEAAQEKVPKPVKAKVLTLVQHDT